MKATECRQSIDDKQQSDYYLSMAKQLKQEEAREEHEKEIFYEILRKMKKEITQATEKAKNSVYVECIYCTQRIADKVRKTLEYNGYNVELLDRKRQPLKFVNKYCNDYAMFFYKIKW